MAQPTNKLLQYAQASGSPYDEEAYMQMPGGSSVNALLNSRLSRQAAPVMQQYMTRDRGGSPPSGSDTDMMMIYGPEDQVAYDQDGNPIRLDDPRHPNNQASVPPMGGASQINQPSQYPQRW